MDYMKLDSFMGRMVSKFINKALAKKFGVDYPDIDIKLQEFNVKSTSVKKEDDSIEVVMRLSMEKYDFEFLVDEVTK